MVLSLCPIGTFKDLTIAVEPKLQFSADPK